MDVLRMKEEGGSGCEERGCMRRRRTGGKGEEEGEVRKEGQESRRGEMGWGWWEKGGGRRQTQTEGGRRGRMGEEEDGGGRMGDRRDEDVGYSHCKLLGSQEEVHEQVLGSNPEGADFRLDLHEPGPHLR